MAQAGQTLFMRYGCSGCHGGNGAGGTQSGSTVRAPSLAGLYGSPVTLADGRIVTADDRYIRDCILMPDTQRVASYPPVMPSFAGHDQRGGSAENHRLHQVFGRGEPVMSATAIEAPANARDPT